MNNRIDFKEIDKINIYLSDDTYNTLNHDMEVFDICRKKNGEINKNDFISRIIVNYGDEFRNNLVDSYNKIKDVLKESWITKDSDYDLVVSNLYNVIEKDKSDKASGHDNVIPFRPQIKNDNLMDELNDVSIFLSEHNMSISDYFRSMLNEFCKLPSNDKERILLSSVYKVIEKAITNKRSINIEVLIKKDKSIDKIDTVCSPYALLPSRDTGFNYLLAVSEDTIRVFKLSDITYVTIDKAPYIIPENLREELKNRKRNPEFAYDSLVDIYVLLTDRGVTMLHRIKTLRPSGREIDDKNLPKEISKIVKKVRKSFDDKLYLYRFTSSKKQAEFYFERFGKNAIVVYPTELNEIIKNYYSDADRYYNL